MNNNGQVIFYGFMLGLIIVITALALSGPIREQIDSVRNTTTIDGGVGMDCGNDTISDFDKAACVSTDLTIFYFIGGLIFIAGAVITARFVLG